MKYLSVVTTFIWACHCIFHYLLIAVGALGLKNAADTLAAGLRKPSTKTAVALSEFSAD